MSVHVGMHLPEVVPGGTTAIAHSGTASHHVSKTLGMMGQEVSMIQPDLTAPAGTDSGLAAKPAMPSPDMG